jgi:diguanylate cyclase (GGDEF)-like protein
MQTMMERTHSSRKWNADQQGPTVFIAHLRNSVRHDLVQHVERFGYQAQAFHQVDPLINAISHTLPAALIMDLDFVTSDETVAQRIATHLRGQTAPIPVVFTSRQTDLRSHLQAIRAGGQAYLPEPIDATTLVDLLDQVSKRPDADPYRIVMVDDDPMQIQAYTMLLTSAGMRVASVTAPARALQTIAKVQPDLILLDIHMPVCLGTELMAVIRQQPEFLDIPIVFLTGETAMSVRQEAIRLGADDFLLKPVRPDQLISIIKSRVQRTRVLRNHLASDRLQDVLHFPLAREMNEHLAAEVAQANGEHHPVTFAILEVDGMTEIRANEGLNVGDQALRALARLLRTWLNPTDRVGRYYNNALAVTMPNTDSQTAHATLTGIQQQFANIRRQLSGNERFLTLSAGLADTLPQRDAASLIVAANVALMYAKQSGGNQVVIADSSCS